MKNKIVLFFLIILFSSRSGFAQDEILNTIIKIVSPIEISALIKDLNVKYDKTILNAPEKFINYQSDFKKSLNLGVYSTDLGYANINEQPQDALSYLNSVKKMADGLSLGGFIDFNKIFTLAANKNNLNKLLDETSTTFENMSAYLEQNNKSNLAALILTGGWLETLYITCRVAQQTPNPELTTRIVEQKLILGQLLEVLTKYQSDNNMQNLVNDLKNLNQLFAKYKFNTTDNTNVSTKEENGILVVTSEGEKEEIEVTPQELKNISDLVAEIRSKIIG